MIVKRYAFLTLFRWGWVVSVAFCTLSSRGKYSRIYCIGGWVSPIAGLDVVMAKRKILVPATNLTPVLQPVAKHFTNRATEAAEWSPMGNCGDVARGFPLSACSFILLWFSLLISVSPNRLPAAKVITIIRQNRMAKRLEGTQKVHWRRKRNCSREVWRGRTMGLLSTASL